MDIIEDTGEAMSRESFNLSDKGRSMQSSSTQQHARHFDIGCADHNKINRLLKKLLSRLSRVFSIEKASLIIYDHEKDSLRVTHMLNKGTLRSSLALTIPDNFSLLHQVFMQGYPIVDNYPELISRNVIEKKILLARDTQSVAVIPLIYDGTRLGLLSLASHKESAFSLYLEGMGEDNVVEFVAELSRVLTSTANTL